MVADPFSDDYEPAEGPYVAPTKVAGAKKPKVKVTAAERRANQATKKRQTSAKIGAATRQRRNWEASPVGQARRKDIVDLATEAHNATAAGDSRLPVIKGRSGITKAQIYHHVLNATNEGHGYGDQQLPGFENPNAAPQPPRWEELSGAQQSKTKGRMREFGTDLEQMKNDFGAGLDQSMWRAHMAGAHVPAPHPGHGEPEATPFTAHFYGEHPREGFQPLDRPKEMMRESRGHLAAQGIDQVDPMVHTAAIGHVSPNVKFTQGPPGDRKSPNIEAAESVFEQVHQGIGSKSVGSGKNREGVRNQSRPANARRAARMIEHVAGGNPLATARNAPSESNPRGSTQWGPKTGPFTNSFDAQHPDFLVGDVHTGGGGMLPHLGTSKPVKRDENGKRVRTKEFEDDDRTDAQLIKEHGERGGPFQIDKSGREKGIEHIGSAIPGSESKKVTMHSAMDYAARQAIAERGLGTSVRRPQASQWGEEQIQRKAASPKLDVPSHEDAYPSPKSLVNPSQMKLFTD